jgi:hypothetical protein
VQVIGTGALIILRGKTGWRVDEIGCGSGDRTCPVHAVTQWLHSRRIDFSPVFVTVSRNRLKASADRLSNKHVARLIKICVEKRPACARVSPAAQRRMSAMSASTSATPPPS